MRNAGPPVSRVAIIEQVRKFGLDTMSNVVDAYILNYVQRRVAFGHGRPLIQAIRAGLVTRSGKTPSPASSWRTVQRYRF
jgi:DNA-binding response OmpR family regulator